ncbi:hypothetical protein M9H77_12966 [Catharanthus roseus]|uniref:Uncharacterized protein n=1 Tax=Catharanthus roseus TaxID=4058 RepID=A0ACC0BIY9_CATRO|nr:hypothetical protein M9H77_12966 [Catharanthus roseus]
MAWRGGCCEVVYQWGREGLKEVDDSKLLKAEGAWSRGFDSEGDENSRTPRGLAKDWGDYVSVVQITVELPPSMFEGSGSADMVKVGNYPILTVSSKVTWLFLNESSSFFFFCCCLFSLNSSVTAAVSRYSWLIPRLDGLGRREPRDVRFCQLHPFFFYLFYRDCCSACVYSISLLIICLVAVAQSLLSVDLLMAIGSIMYSMIFTRPDIAYSISLLSRFMSNPGRDHWAALKWLLRYINGTIYRGLYYHNWTEQFELVGYVDSDFAGNCVSWKSQLQPVVTLSTMEAEYIAAT